MAVVLAVLTFLGSCSDTPVRLLCARGELSTTQSGKMLADELYRERRLIFALDTTIDESRLMARACEEVENCLEFDVIDRSRSSPTNLLVRLVQPLTNARPMPASGVYLSQVNEYTDSTHFIELTQLTPKFPAQIDKVLCLDISAARK